MPQGNGEGNIQAPLPAQMRKVWFTVIAVAVILVALVAGVELARGNSDIICSRSFQDSGSCTSGSWGPWSVTSQSTDQNACTSTYNETRTYTGLRNTISSTISVSANAHSHCALSDEAFQSGSGTITSQFSACQIQESRTRVVAGTGSGASCVIPNNTSTSTNQNQNQGQITSDTNTETTGAVDDSRTETVSGAYQLYLDMIDARLATSSLRVAPALVHSEETTHVIWTSSHVKSCVVKAPNGDTWSTLVSAVAGEISKPIVQSTTYTLTCLTALGNSLVSHATVNIIPKFQEI